MPPSGTRGPLYRQAQQAASDGQTLLEAAQPESAIRRLWTAGELFRQAALTPVEPPRDVATGRADPAGAPPTGARPDRTPAVTPTTPASAGVPVPTSNDADLATDHDLAGVANTLDRYRAALEQLDGAALEQVYPSVPRDIITALAEYDAYTVLMSNTTTQLEGGTATVSTQLSFTIRTGTGLTADASGPAVFRLEKRGPTDWLIMGIDMSQVR